MLGFLILFEGVAACLGVYLRSNIQLGRNEKVLWWNTYSRCFGTSETRSEGMTLYKKGWTLTSVVTGHSETRLSSHLSSFRPAYLHRLQS